MQRLLDIVYPRNCMGCGVSSPEPFNYICWDCWSDADRVEAPFCQVCGDPVAGAIDHEYTCFTCSNDAPVYEKARSVVRYNGTISEALRQLKYHAALWVAPDLAELLKNCVDAEFSGRTFDYIVPVPLFHVRRRERGFNQAAILGAELGKRLKCKMTPGLLRRIRPTATQTNLTASQRLSNVKKAFESRRVEKLAGKHILLVDDVMTTGATVNACAKALKKGGATSVNVLTVARG